MPSNRHVAPSRDSSQQLQIINGLLAIPDQVQDIVIAEDISFSAPLYWQLPQIFLGDKVNEINNVRYRYSY